LRTGLTGTGSGAVGSSQAYRRGDGGGYADDGAGCGDIGLTQYRYRGNHNNQGSREQACACPLLYPFSFLIRMMQMVHMMHGHGVITVIAQLSIKPLMHGGYQFTVLAAEGKTGAGSFLGIIYLDTIRLSGF